MRLELIIWLGVAGYFLIIAIILVRVYFSRRMQLGLRWPSSTTQAQMERYGTRYLAHLGWSVVLLSSHATRSLYCCEWGDEKILPIFLRDSAFYVRLLASLRRENSWVLSRTVIVLYDRPTERMLALSEEAKISVIHFSDLWQIEDLHQDLLPNVMATRGKRRQPNPG